MITFATRRWIGILSLVVGTVVLAIAHARWGASTPRIIYIYGWLLFALMLLLALYNARKKVAFLPLGSSETWLQIHIYCGLFTFVLFLFHISFRWPTGWFECILAWLYILVAGSGLVGLVLTRAFPKRLTTRGGEVLFERIPSIRHSLQEQAEQLALQSIPDVKSSTIAKFYVRDLKDFFDGTRHFWFHLLEVRRPLNARLKKINDLNRYLNDEEKKKLAKLAELVRQKDGLDFHYALQFVLKAWLFVHIPLTYGLLIFMVVHVVLVYAFSGGAR